MHEIRIVLFITILLSVLGCSNEHWDGYVYPEKGNSLVHYHVGRFNRLDECREASLTMLKAKHALQRGYYECGKNCKSDSGYYIRSCEETMHNLYSDQ